MVSEFAKSALEFLKLAPRYLVSVALMAGVLLFFPAPWLDRIGLESFARTNRQWLGLTFLISAILWGVAVFAAFGGWIRRRALRRRIEQHVIRKLNSLTEDEKQILRYYLARNTRANTLKVDDGVVQGLVEDRIIYRSASMGNLIEGFAHNISDFAWDYLHVNSHLLQGSTNLYRTDKRESDW